MRHIRSYFFFSFLEGKGEREGRGRIVRPTVENVRPCFQVGSGLMWPIEALSGVYFSWVEGNFHVKLEYLRGGQGFLATTAINPATWMAFQVGVLTGGNIQR